MINRALSSFRYILMSDRIWNWRFGTGACPSCSGRFFISMAKGDSNSLLSGPFMCRCISCRANIINLSLIPVIKNYLVEKSLNPKSLIAWEMSTYGATLNFMKLNFGHVYHSEYFPGVKSGNFVDGILAQDCTETSFDDASLDIITSNQVLEHVPNFDGALSEAYRILKPGGAYIFSIPLYSGKTCQKANIDQDGSIEFFGPPEYHDSRLGGPKSAPVFWRHGSEDVISLIEKIGFQCKMIDIFITKAQRSPMKVLYAQKPYWS